MDHIYEPQLEYGNDIVPMSASSIRHVKALRLRQGERIIALNGRGLSATCELTAERPFELKVIDQQQEPQPMTLRVALGVLDHRDRFEFAIEKAVELGATQFTPLRTERSFKLRSTMERMRSKAIAAMTQSGMPWLLSIDEAMSISDCVSQLENGSRRLVGHANGDRITAGLVSGPVVVFVGPEGGFTDEELARMESPLTTPIAIGRKRLRAETAAIALMAMVTALR
jgi:16S rRNA (uracil1498-N3)-methyltransferase